MVVSFDDDLVDIILDGPYWLNGGGESDEVTDIDVNIMYHRWPVKQVSENTDTIRSYNIIYSIQRRALYSYLG